MYLFHVLLKEAAMKDWFIAEQEHICAEYADGTLDRADAFRLLVRMGFDPHEAYDLLDNADK